MVAKPVKRGKVWYTYYWDSGGKDRKKKWVRLDEEKAWADVKLGEIQKKLLAKKYGRELKEIRWDTFCSEYLTYSQANKTKESYLADERAIRYFNERFPISTLSDLTPMILEAYKSKRKQEKAGGDENAEMVKESSINRELNSLKAIASKAVEWEYLNKNPWRGVKRFEEHVTAPTILTEDQQNALLASCGDAFEVAMVMLGLHAGLRRGEMANLKKEDIHFERGVIRIVSGMGRRTKTKRERFVPLTPQLAKALRAQMKESRGEYLFEICGEKVASWYLSKIHKRIKNRAGVSAHLHLTRHTYGSNLANAGVPLNIVQELLGHRRITTTQIYLHSNSQAKMDAVKKLPRYKLGRKK